MFGIKCHCFKHQKTINKYEEKYQQLIKRDICKCERNLIKIQSFIIQSYEHLTVARSRSCADDLCNFHLREFHQPIKMIRTCNFEILHTSNSERFQLSEFSKLRFDRLTIKVICTWPSYYGPLFDLHTVV